MSSIQNGGMDVDRLAVALEEAAALVRLCRAKLFKVDEEVKQLLEDVAANDLE